MILMVLVLLAVCIGLPLYYSWRVWRLDAPTRAAWLATAAEAATLVALVMIVGRWDMAGLYTRYALIALFLAALGWSWRRHMRRPWGKADGAPRRRWPILRAYWPQLSWIAVFGAALLYVLSGMLPGAPARALAFPLQGGRFIVGQGGGVMLLNQHAGHEAQRYAADITALNAAGFRAGGLLPKTLDRYAIYGAQVVSPCGGEVIGVRVGLPDLAPPQADAENPAGNHVVLDCMDLHVELAHLQQGGVTVSVGDVLQAGDPIGRVGNSGNTTEPHLHIHAMDPETGAGIPLEFDGRAPLRNRVYVR